MVETVTPNSSLAASDSSADKDVAPLLQGINLLSVAGLPATDLSSERALQGAHGENGDNGGNAGEHDSTQLTVLENLVDGVTSNFLIDKTRRHEIDRYASEFVTTAAMFTGGKAGWIATGALWGLNNSRSGDPLGQKVEDFALGACKGTAVKGLYALIGERVTLPAAKGVAMGLASQAANDVFQRDLFTKPRNVLGRLNTRLHDAPAFGYDALSWSIGEGVFAGLNKSFGGSLSRNRCAGTMLMGGLFGMMNGGHQELLRQRNIQNKKLFTDIDWLSVARSGLFHGGIDAAAAGLGARVTSPPLHLRLQNRVELGDSEQSEESLEESSAQDRSPPKQNRRGGLKQYEGSAFEILTKAALNGENKPALEARTKILSGEGIKPDTHEGLGWLKLAAERGFPDAEKYMGDCYMQGKSVPADAKEAIRWYESAAQHGSSSACRALSMLYDRGLGVSINPEQSEIWSQKAKEAAEKETARPMRLSSQRLGIVGRSEVVRLPENVIRIPLTRQATDYTCGAAALQSILMYYGEEVLEHDLAKDLKSNNDDGTRYKEIERYGKTHGYDVVTHMDASLEELKAAIDTRKPALVLIQAWPAKPVDYPGDWNDGHYVVAVGYDAQNLYFMDPSTLGNYTYIPISEFMDRWHDIDGRQKLNHFFMTVSKPTPTYDPDAVPKIG